MAVGDEAGLGIAQAGADYGVTLAHLRAVQAQGVDHLPGHGVHAVVFQADHARQLVEIVGHPQVLQERLDVGQWNGADRGLLARAWLDCDTVQVSQADDVAWIDQVRVLDLRIGLPDFRPQPGLLQELPGDVPERVAPFHHISVGVRAGHFGGRSIGGHDEGGSGKNRTKFSEHG